MLIRGHSSAPCYWNRADKTSETMRGDWMVIITFWVAPTI